MNKNRRYLTLYLFLNGSILAATILLTLFEKRLNLPLQISTALQITITFLAAISGFLVPMWTRIYYAKRSNTAKDLDNFEKINILSSSFTFLLALLAFATNTGRWSRYFIALMALYVLYTSFPSKDKINFDKKLLHIE